MSLLDEFVKKNVIDRQDAGRVEEEMSTGKTLDEILLDKQVDPLLIFSTKKEYYSSMTPREYNEDLVPAEILRYVPQKSAMHYKFVPIGKDIDGDLEIGIIDPDNLAAKSAIGLG